MSRTKEFNETVVLEKALGAFLGKGYESTSIADVVAATGISRQSLYDTYGDKRALYIKALKFFCVTKFGNLTALLRKDQPVREVLIELKAMLKSMLTSKDSASGCLLVNSIATGGCQDDRVIREMIQEAFARRDQALEALLTRGQKEGTVAKKYSAKALAQTFNTGILGLSIQARKGLPSEDMECIIDVMFEGTL